MKEADRVSLLQQSQRTRGPFDKVTEMIKEMVNRLEQEQAEDQTKDQYCKESLKKATEKKEKLAKEIEKFKNRVSTTEALLEEQDIGSKETAKETALIQEEEQKEKTLRAKEEGENKETLEEAKSNEEGLKGAVAALERTYGGTSEPAAPPAEEQAESFLQLQVQTASRTKFSLSKSQTTKAAP